MASVDASEGKKRQSIMGTVNQQLDLLKRHAQVLELLVKSKRPLGILKLSKLMACPAHQIRYSLRELENINLIIPTTQGAKIGGSLSTFITAVESDLKRVYKQLDELNKHIENIKKQQNDLDGRFHEDDRLPPY